MIAAMMESSIFVLYVSRVLNLLLMSAKVLVRNRPLSTLRGTPVSVRRIGANAFHTCQRSPCSHYLVKLSVRCSTIIINIFPTPSCVLQINNLSRACSSVASFKNGWVDFRLFTGWWIPVYTIEFWYSISSPLVASFLSNWKSSFE